MTWQCERITATSTILNWTESNSTSDSWTAETTQHGTREIRTRVTWSYNSMQDLHRLYDEVGELLNIKLWKFIFRNRNSREQCCYHTKTGFKLVRFLHKGSTLSEVCFHSFVQMWIKVSTTTTFACQRKCLEAVNHTNFVKSLVCQTMTYDSHTFGQVYRNTRNLVC